MMFETLRREIMLKEDRELENNALEMILEDLEADILIEDYMGIDELADDDIDLDELDDMDAEFDDEDEEGIDVDDLM